MAIAAIKGVTKPATATGTAMTLYATASIRFSCTRRFAFRAIRTASGTAIKLS